jgi:REP element-mobilizing transposase RayT
MVMAVRNHLRRLPRKFYRGDAIVHWEMTILDRQKGWLTNLFLYRWRELLTHTCFRYQLVCPIFCLMPDHVHLVWQGIHEDSDQLPAMRHLRTNVNGSLRRIGFSLQDQAYDHVLTANERLDVAFREVCEYIARNPERAGIVAPDAFASYRYSGCLLPGYPLLRLFDDKYWDEYDRIVPFLKSNGLSLSRSGLC